MLGKNKSEILGIFFSAPDRSYYTGEIGRILNKKPGVFQKTLDKLVAEGILESEYRGNQRYFWLNKNYIFYNELKSIIYKTTGLLNIIKQQLQEINGIIFAFIYGSFANDSFNSLSDVDLFIIGNVDENEILKLTDKIEKTSGREINYKILSEEKLKVYLRQKDPFILNVINGKKVFITGDENEFRKIVEGQSHKKTKTRFQTDR